MWNAISTEDEINNFLDLFGWFHDSCIKEIRYIGGAYVNKDLSMMPINNERTVDVVFQRQYKNPSTIILRFLGLKTLHLAPCDDNYSCEIYRAFIVSKNGHFYWTDFENAANASIEKYDGTWICADKIQWRVIDECIGKEEIFAAKC